MENTDERSSVKCKTHPKAPHGFLRDASHNEGRYVCECEFWEPPKNKPMTRDEWIAWLRESWDEAQERASTPEQKPSDKEKLAKWMMAKGYATGHGDSTEDLLQELEWQIREQEREACAMVAEKWPHEDERMFSIAQAIRARGEQ